MKIGQRTEADLEGAQQAPPPPLKYDRHCIYFYPIQLYQNIYK